MTGEMPVEGVENRLGVVHFSRGWVVPTPERVLCRDGLAR
jgi:hypothetical protein